MVKFNGNEINYNQFAFDGCHKIYLLNDNEIDAAKGNGYQVYPIDRLAEKYVCSCGLRFIDTWSDLKSVVPQCESKVEIDNNGTMLNVDFITDTINGRNSYEFAKAVGWNWFL